MFRSSDPLFPYYIIRWHIRNFHRFVWRLFLFQLFTNISENNVVWRWIKHQTSTLPVKYGVSTLILATSASIIQPSANLQRWDVPVSCYSNSCSLRMKASLNCVSLCKVTSLLPTLPFTFGIEQTNHQHRKVSRFIDICRSLTTPATSMLSKVSIMWNNVWTTLMINTVSMFLVSRSQYLCIVWKLSVVAVKPLKAIFSTLVTSHRYRFGSVVLYICNTYVCLPSKIGFCVIDEEVVVLTSANWSVYRVISWIDAKIFSLKNNANLLNNTKETVHARTSHSDLQNLC